MADAPATTSSTSPRAQDASSNTRSSARRGGRHARGNSSRRRPPAAAVTGAAAAADSATSTPTATTATTTSLPNDKAPRSRAKKANAKGSASDSSATPAATNAATQAATPRLQTPIESLVHAIRCNDLAAFRTVLAAHANLDVSKQFTPDGDAALVEACRYARHDMVATLLQDQRASLNVAATNKRANRHGLTPLAAACMTLDAALVDLLLQADAQSPSRVLLTGRVNAVVLCALMSVANGYAESQAVKATALLEKLLAHAQTTDKLADVLAFETEKGNRLVHVVAGAANWRALAVLRAVGADVNVVNRLGRTPLSAVEANAFERRNMAQRTPFQSNGSNKKKQKQKAASKGSGKQLKRETQDETDPVVNEPVSAADAQTRTVAKKVDRGVETTEVIRTYLEFAKTLGFACMFSRKGDSPVGFPMRCLVLAHVGFVNLANEFARAPDESKTFVIDGLVYTLVAMYAASLKRAKEYAGLWQRALAAKPTTDDNSDKLASSISGDKTETVALTPTAFKLIIDDMLANRSLSRRVQTMAMVLMRLEALYAGNAPPMRDASPNQSHLRALSLYESIAERLYRSGVKLLFCIFDRTDIDEDECYDEEIEFHLLLALTELFFQCFVPFAHAITDSCAPTEQLPAAVAFERATAWIKQLWPLLEAGMRSIDDPISSPQRFSLVLHVVQVFAQVESSLRADDAATVAKLFRIMKQFVRSEATKKRVDHNITSKVHLLQTIGRALPLPQSFRDRITPLTDKLDILIRSDPKIVGVDLYALAPLPNIIRLEHKVDYLGVLAEEQPGSVSVSINRASASNHVDFILQQVLSTNARNMRGELSITLINEPGVGVGVIREFFQIVQQCFFSPSFTMHRSAAAAESEPVAPHVAEIGSSWLHSARAESLFRRSSASSRSRSDTAAAVAGYDHLAQHFPLFEYVDRATSDELRIATRPLQVKRSVLDAKQRSDALSLRPDDIVTDSQALDTRKKLYQCVGRLLGLAIRNHQPLCVTFPLALWKFLMHERVAWCEYCGTNAVFQRSLEFVLAHDFDASPLEMHFEYTTDVVVVDDARDATASDSSAGAASPTTTTMEMPLKPSSHAPAAVTNANKLEYVELRAKQHFFGHELALYHKMRDGLLETLSSADLRLFRADELQRIARGERVIDFGALKQSVLYSSGASLEHGVIKMFWDVVDTFDQVEREQLLTFWSGSPQPPLFGFASTARAMSSDAAIWYIDVDTRMKSSHCPMANTCDRRLILPDYPSAAVLKEKLSVALRLGAVGYDRM